MQKILKNFLKKFIHIHFTHLIKSALYHPRRARLLRVLFGRHAGAVARVPQNDVRRGGLRHPREQQERALPARLPLPRAHPGGGLLDPTLRPVNAPKIQVTIRLLAPTEAEASEPNIRPTNIKSTVLYRS